MAEWVPIENSISLEALLKRWKGIEIDGEKFDFQTIDNFVRGCQITAYDRKDWVIVNGSKEWRGQKRAPHLGLNGSDPFNPGVDIIFDQQEIVDIERQMFPPSEKPRQRTAGGSTMGKTEWPDSNAIRGIESLATIPDSLCRNNLILAHNADGTICPPKLAAFPSKIFFTQMPRPDEGDFYSSHDLMERYELGPAEFVEYLMAHKDLFPHGVPNWFYIQHHIDESGFGYEYQPMSRKVEELDNLTFHYRTIRNHERMMQESGYYDRYYNEWRNKATPTEDRGDSIPSRLAELEAQLAEAQKKIEDVEGVRRWNKQFLAERAELQTALEGKDTHIAELEKELAAAKEKIAELETSNTELTTTTRTQAATEARQDKVLSNWHAAFKIMIPVILQCHADGPKKRTKTELQSMCSKHGRGLSATQLDFLRDCLPDEHVNREGGATVQG